MQKLQLRHLKCKITVDVKFCPGYYVYFHFWALDPFVTSFEFGPRTLSLFSYFNRVFESSWFSYLFRVYFVSNRYLPCCVASYRAMFLFLFALKRHFIYLIMFHNSSSLSKLIGLVTFRNFFFLINYVSYLLIMFHGYLSLLILFRVWSFYTLNIISYLCFVFKHCSILK